MKRLLEAATLLRVTPMGLLAAVLAAYVTWVFLAAGNTAQAGVVLLTAAAGVAVATEVTRRDP